MVVKVAEYTGTLNCRNCVIVPYSSNINNSQVYCENPEKPNTNHCASQTLSTSLFRQQNDSETEQLWHKQFTRWWTWNWRRKRTTLLKKLRKKHRFCDGYTKKNILTKNQSVQCNFPEVKQKIKNKETKSTICTNSIKNGRLHQFNCNYEPTKPIEQFIPVFAKCSSHINKPYKSRKKQNKQKDRLYEGWMREVCSSDTESDTTTDVVVKGKKSHENRMHYLSLRLRKLNSDLFDEKTSDTSIITTTTTTKVKSDVNVAEYKSPISGKIYNLNLSKTQAFHIKPDEINYINSKSCTDEDFLAKPEFACTTQYYQIRNEHFEILNSICKIINKPTITEDKKIQSNLDETNVLEKTSRVVEFIPKQNINLTESFNLYTNGYMANISRSLPIFMEQNPENDILIDLNKNKSNTTTSYCDLTISDDYYDINYIHNNVDVFKSSITETSFIWDYLKRNKNY